ncbi:epsin-3 isoform X2 [Chanos chanos]|uniref:Epsin-3 isoform X2 n=1 Tax=Chanos chanos TaxID=29144 RepID=A0A6J2WKI1_CHACN|nr:epsin-3 isoform X2 [Chanos chanos]
MTTSSLRRSVKNIVNNYTDAEIKVREATSNDPWGPPSSLMLEIADLTFNVVAFTEIMGIIWKRLNDHGKNWRHVYKALTLLDYLLKAGSERVVQHCKENIYAIQTLRDFQYIDRDGQDQGMNVREKSKQLVALVRDEERLKQERAQAHKTRERMTGAGAMGYGALPPPYPGRRTSQPSMSAIYGEQYSRSRGSPSSHYSSSSSPQLAPDLEQARPQTSGEEELQLQLALAMSREESEKPAPPPPAAALDMDEDTQLQLALSLSKEEHQQEQQSRQGDESMLQKALEESKREMESRGGGSAMMDLVDIFAPASAVPPSASPWELSSSNNQPQSAGPLRSDPWDSLDGGSRGVGSSWMAPSGLGAQSQPWDSRLPSSDPWESSQISTSPVPTDQVWTSSTRTDPFLSSGLDKKGAAGLTKVPSPRAGSPSDGDLFDEAMDGGQVNVNGHGEGNMEPFDLSRLGEHLPDPKPRTCRTPETFLGPEAASLVNLDSLIPSNPTSKTLNPFLSEMSAPSTTNPFQSEPPRPTLNQMRPSSTSPVPTSLPYSASLPLPASNQPSSLPNSFTQPAQGPLDIPGNLPQPLLPLSSTSSLGQQAADQHSQNPFL